VITAATFSTVCVSRIQRWRARRAGLQGPDRPGAELHRSRVSRVHRGSALRVRVTLLRSGRCVDVTATRQHDDSAPRTTIRFDGAVLTLLDAYAAQTRRSRNAAVNHLLALALDREDTPERLSR
jgi:hypothetical protein